MIGLIGGLGIGAGIHYYRKLGAAYEAEGWPLELVMVHAQMSRVFEHAATGDRASLARYMAGLMSSLQAAGATVAVIPAVTPHLAVQELQQISPLPIVNLLDAVAKEVTAGGLRRVALFGTRPVIESDFFGALRDVDVVRPEPDEIEVINQTYMQIARDGKGTREQRETLTALARTMCPRAGLDAILLAGTDLSLVFDEAPADFPHLDCARAHIHAIVRQRADAR